MAWQELMLVPLLAWAGWWVAGRTGRWWAAVVAVAMAVVAALILARRMPSSTAQPIFRWLADARVNPLVMAVVIPILLRVLAVRLAQRRQRVAVHVMTAALLLNYCVLPGAMPLLARGFMLESRTVVDERGICHQTHNFTCGPASMVTCLRVLGVRAEENEVARLSRCGPAVGTDPAVLAEAVKTAFGVQADYRTLSRASELRAPAVIELGAACGWGHYVAAMQRSQGLLLIGDPDAAPGSNCCWVREADLEADWTGRVVEVQAPVTFRFGPAGL